MFEIKFGDCLPIMRAFAMEGRKFDAIIADPPYDKTICSWDRLIPVPPMWECLKKLIKPAGVIVLTASQPLTSILITTNLAMFKYCWVWNKKRSANYLQIKNMPLLYTEDVCVFCGAPIGHKSQLGSFRMPYNPQGIIRVNRPWSRPQKNQSKLGFKRPSHRLSLVSEYENYPNNVLEFVYESGERALHETRKPVALMEYLVRTYTQPGQVVLDFCMGSGSTGEACQRTGRDFVGIEKDEKNFITARRRLYKTPDDSLFDNILDEL